jgi:hypothetical protein
MIQFRKLPGLPASGDSPVVAFPPEWAEEKAEGLIVEFAEGEGRSWIGNFRKGPTRLSQATHHPNGREAVVIADGAMWIVDPQKRAARHFWPDADQTWLVLDPERLVVTDGRSFLCLDADGERWRTQPLTQRAGFDDLRLEGERLRGRAWAVVTRTSLPFQVDLKSGAVYDGGGDGPSQTPFDFSRTAGLEDAPPLSPAGQRQLDHARPAAGRLCLPSRPARHPGRVPGPQRADRRRHVHLRERRSLDARLLVDAVLPLDGGRAPRHPDRGASVPALPERILRLEGLRARRALDRVEGNREHLRPPMRDL